MGIKLANLKQPLKVLLFIYSYIYILEQTQKRSCKPENSTCLLLTMICRFLSAFKKQNKKKVNIAHCHFKSHWHRNLILHLLLCQTRSSVVPLTWRPGRQLATWARAPLSAPQDRHTLFSHLPPGRGLSGGTMPKKQLHYTHPWLGCPTGNILSGLHHFNARIYREKITAVN